MSVVRSLAVFKNTLVNVCVFFEWRSPPCVFSEIFLAKFLVVITELNMDVHEYVHIGAVDPVQAMFLHNVSRHCL